MSSCGTIGEPIPSNDLHAVSVSLPTWDANLGWASRDARVVNRMNNGYPRFFIHSLVTQLSRRVVAKFGSNGEQALLLSSRIAAERCMSFLSHDPKASGNLRTIELRLDPHRLGRIAEEVQWAAIHAVFFPNELFKAAKAFWQNTGQGISSRRAEYCHSLFDRLEKCEKSEQPSMGSVAGSADHAKAQTQSASKGASTDQLCSLVQADSEKYKIRSFVASMVSEASNSIHASDVFLYASGMSAFWDLARAFKVYRSSDDSKIIVIYGFLYVDTVKVLSRIESQEVVLYGHGNEADLDKLEAKLAGGVQIQALYCEFPGNPLLISPDLQRIRTMADKYDFVIVCDDTVGTAVNVNVIPYVDVLCTSLTKLFSGACNVMGGSLVLNPSSRYHDIIHDALSSIFVDDYFPLDAVLMEHNSRDFVSRVLRININAESIVELLNAHRTVERVFYPKNSDTRVLYERCKRPGAGYGHLMSILFKKPSYAKTFFDTLDVAKGPSLGTNFTLACPYTLLAHYAELAWASSYGVVEDLVRISVGLEEAAILLAKVNDALEAIELNE